MEHKALFIDDEPLLREMYESLAPALHGTYEIHTAASAEVALQLILRARFDVIVTDFAMPGMDGLQFLSQAVLHQPDCPRIIISGYADRLKIAHCLFVGHRYFSKPCDLNVLANLLLRLASFRGVMSNDKVRRVIGGLGSLPGPPETFLKLEALLDSPSSSAEEIGQLVEQDPVLTAKLLQIVNSAPLGLASQVYSAVEAVQHLGVSTVRALALGLHVFTVHHKRTGKLAPSPEIWNHSLRVATNARAIARAQGFSNESCQRAFLAGLLHDIGKIVVHANAPQESSEVTELVRRCQVPSVIAEAQRFRATYADVGAYLLTLWGIDDEVAAIVQFHERLDAFVVNDVPALAAVHVAHSMDAANPIAHPLQLEYLAALGFTDADRWPLATAASLLSCR